MALIFLSLIPFASSEAPKPEFEFGLNWQYFLSSAKNDEGTLKLENRLYTATQQILADFNFGENDTFEGLTFIDVGCGSGLHSLAAYQLGAHVLSIDALETSVRATEDLRASMNASEDRWKVMVGNILEPNSWYDGHKYDLVYAWGSLHHTGQFWNALDNAVKLAKLEGRIYVAAYLADEESRHWLGLKQQYMESTPSGRRTMVYAYIHFGLMNVVNEKLHSIESKWTAQGLPLLDVERYQVVLRIIHQAVEEHSLARGMDLFTDAEDWMGGWPTEFIRPDHLCLALGHFPIYPIRSAEITAGMLSFLGTPDEKAFPSRMSLSGPFQRAPNGCWHVRVPIEWPSGSASSLQMYESDTCLGLAYHLLSSSRAFCNNTGGYFHHEGNIFFTPNNLSDPNTNGHIYNIFIPSSWNDAL